MASANKLVVLLIVSIGIVIANGDDDKSLGDKCGAEFQKVAACLTYATGKAPSPSKECCDAAEDIKDHDPVCLCYIIEQIHKGSSPQLKSMGIQEEKLLQLPSACKLTNASISNCPKLLNIPPTSPDYAIFTNATSKSPVSTTPSASSSSSSPDTNKDVSNGYKNGPQLSVTGTIVAAALVAIFLAVLIPTELLVF
ncbi:non-specific lipid transfer protein GPI-anchored 1 [Solanum pennellii]|uniref:Non-specific lipid transfer protein GPI-anchored 1 n=1 Tax=Solanum pennellii TaxID=28526 RepID=A0ABM1GQL0_SOLPN|nr:non-specific lipid transfer protein GPI-anchored 1 [Solanum pennellii]